MTVNCVNGVFAGWREKYGENTMRRKLTAGILAGIIFGTQLVGCGSASPNQNITSESKAATNSKNTGNEAVNGDNSADLQNSLSENAEDRTINDIEETIKNMKISRTIKLDTSNIQTFNDTNNDEVINDTNTDDNNDEKSLIDSLIFL